MAGEVVVVEGDEFYRRAAERFAQAADESVRERGGFSVALSGGSTPNPLYSLLAEQYKDSIPWKKVHAFFGDERCVPPDRPDSNYRMADESLLSKVDIPPENVHRMKGELEPEVAAEEYARELVDFFGLNPGDFPSFDLILLGMGEEGHTASLFPGSDVLEDRKNLVRAAYVPKLDSHRLTLTPPVILNARSIMPLVMGDEKADALEKVLDGPYDPTRYPAQILRNARGEVVWLVDPAAAAGLSSE